MEWDPLGPGSKAWNAFDNAVEAYRSCQVKDRRRDALFRRYGNQRDQMVLYVKAEGGDVAAWCEALRGAVGARRGRGGLRA